MKIRPRKRKIQSSEESFGEGDTPMDFEESKNGETNR